VTRDRPEGGAAGGYERAIDQALVRIRAADPDERARAAGIEIVIQSSGAPLFRIVCLGAERLFDPASGEITPKPPSTKERVLIARYVARAAAREPAGRWISFREIPGGSFYWQAFESRTSWLAARIRKEGVGLADRARRLGGGEIPLGDAGIWVPIFPRIPAALILWEGGEEFPPSQSILFDETFPEHLDAEDAAVAAEIFLQRLT